MKNGKMWGIVIVVVLVIGAGAYYMSMQSPKAPVDDAMMGNEAMGTDDTMMADEAMKGPITVALSPQNESGIRGTATIEEVNGKAKVTLQYNGAPAGIAQPAHIHVGSCAEIGAVKYPLASALDGTSVTQLDVSLATLLGEKPWAINVHKSAEEVSVYVACGDETLSNTAAN